MKSKVYYVYQFSLLFVAFACGSAEPEANTTFGPVRGVWLKTELGAEIAGFLGLPYAEPPVGELRFEVLKIYWSFCGITGNGAITLVLLEVSK